MTGHRDNIFWAEQRGLLQDSAADLGEGDAMGGGLEPIITAGGLHRLKYDSADTRLLDRIIDDAAEFVVVHTALHGDHERGREAQLVQLFYGCPSDLPQVESSKFTERRLLQRIELQV